MQYPWIGLLALTLGATSGCRSEPRKLAAQSCTQAALQDVTGGPLSFLPREEISAATQRRLPCDESAALLRGRYQERVVDMAESALPPETILIEEGSGRRYRLELDESIHPPESGARIEAQGLVTDCANRPAFRASSIRLLGETSQKGLTQALAGSRSLGMQSVAVILLSFRDQNYPTSAEEARRVVFDEVSDFLRESSYGQTWLSGRVLGPYPTTASRNDCDPDELATQALAQARSSGVDLSTYSRLIYAFPRNSCGWYGLGTIGGFPSESWINGSMVLHTVAHELGHNFGLYHSNALDCGRGVTLGSGCRVIEYGDSSDAMGNRVPGHFNSFQKERIGWLDGEQAPAISRIASSGNYFVEPLSMPSLNPKALKIPRALAGANAHYYVEYRQPWGFDSIFSRLSSPQNLTRGVVIHSGRESSANSSHLLHMNPGEPSWYQAALPVGGVFEDPASGLRIQLASATSEQAMIQVTLQGSEAQCARMSPTLTLAPQRSGWILPGQTFRFTATLKNNDSEACASSRFTLTHAAGDGISAALVAEAEAAAELGSIELAPGASRIVELDASSSALQAGGAYIVELNAERSQDVFSRVKASGELLVSGLESATLLLLKEFSQPARGQDLSFTVALADRGEPLAGKRFRVRIQGPHAVSAQHEGFTDSSGMAHVAFHLSQCSAPGLYEIELETELDGGMETIQSSVLLQ